MQNTKTAFFAIVGVPNVGKSSILNSMIGEKISIVSCKPQTTRTRIMGILTEGETQLVFIDTPGIHKPRTQLGKYMDKSISESVAAVDSCLLVVQAGREIQKEEIDLINRFKQNKMRAILAINKVDLLKNKSTLMNQIDKFNKLFKFEAVVPVSAKDGSGIDILKQELKTLAEPGMHLFDEDDITDQPERVIVAEVIREKILQFFDKEIPHGVAVAVERMRERENCDIVDIDTVIYCERASHKGILIGKQGSMLKKIGTAARIDIEAFLGTKINLKIWVKVKEDWRNREFLLRNFGFACDKT